MTNRRVTKTMALAAANRAAEKLFSERFEKALEALRIRVEEILKVEIPYPVQAVVKEFPDWISTTDSVCLYKIIDTQYGERRSSYVDCKLSFRVPYACSTLKVNNKVFDELANLKLKKDRTIKERDDFEARLFESILALKTENRIKESMPEILPYIDFPVEKQLPSPMFDDVRAQLRNLNK